MSTTSASGRTNDQKIALFQKRFHGLEHIYGTYDPASGRSWQVKAAVTRDVILDHLQGCHPFGVYLLVDDRTHALVADFDQEDPLPPYEFVLRCRHYGVPAYVERSKRKGWHVWVFADPPGIPAAAGRQVMRWLLSEIGQADTEVFPKQDRLVAGSDGNFINAPLFGPLVRHGRTVFVDVDNNFEPYPNQGNVLEGIQCISQAQIDELVEINDLNVAARDAGDSATAVTARVYGLTPCAQRMLAEGVPGYQRVSCFRLAIHLKRAGIPQDMASALLLAWACKNHPPARPRITDDEVLRQTRGAYARNYASYGCEDSRIQPYCDPCCPIFQSRAVAKGATDHATGDFDVLDEPHPSIANDPDDDGHSSDNVAPAGSSPSEPAGNQPPAVSPVRLPE